MNARRAILFCTALLVAAAAHAAPRVFLDRDHVELGGTVTLNIEGAGLAASPDLTPLAKDFDVLGTSSSSSVQVVNGSTHASNQLGIALRPKRAGDLAIPPLKIGNAQTQALVLHVAAAPSGAQGNPGDDAFLEAGVDSPAPYVGQQDVYTLRLFYASGLTGGQLDDPQADGAQLVHLNGDTRYQTQRDGRGYQVVERHYALIPQRAGRIVIRGPTFLGQMLDSNGNSNGNDPFDRFFDDGKPVQARADDIVLDARAVPANAGSPWLPAQSVQLLWQGPPGGAKPQAGVPFNLTLTVDATGQPADRLPEPELPPIKGARVYPDRTRDATRDDGHWLHGTRTRSFAIVPGRAGPLQIPAITLNWWDVAHDRAEQARLPARTLWIGGAAPVTTGNLPAAASRPARATETPSPGRARASVWRNVAVFGIALWVITITALAWWLSRRKSGPRNGGDGEAVEPPRDSAQRCRQRALDAARGGDAAACERGLSAWANAERGDPTPGGAWREALADPAQRAALEQLLRARWQGGDTQAACAAVTVAFAKGFVWRDNAHVRRARADGLPPLYPADR